MVLSLQFFQSKTASESRKRLCLLRWSRRLLIHILPFAIVSYGTVRAESISTTVALTTKNSNDLQTTAAPISVNLDSLRDFETCFQTISDKAHVSIFVEGVPLHPKLTKEQAAILLQNPPLNSPTPRTLPVIETIAAAYQYDVEQTDEHTYLLRKKYENPEDLPCVTFPEVVHALKEIDKLANHYAPPDTSNPTALEIRLVDSFSTEELKSAENGIQIGSLEPGQRDLALSVAGALWLGQKAQHLHELLRELTRLDDPTSQFKWLQESKINSFGYEGPFGPSHMRLPVPLTNGIRVSNGGIHIGSIPSDGVDLALPTESDRTLALGMLANRLPSTHTLGEFAKLVPDSEKIRFGVDRAVSDKPFSLFGAQYSSRRHTIRTLAALYGLSLLVPTENDFTITLPQAHSIQAPSDIPNEIRRVVPLPLARFLSGHPLPDSPIFIKEQGAPADVSNLPNLTPERRLELMREQNQKEQARRQQTNAAHDAALEAYYYPAVRRLIAVVSPTTPTPQIKPVAISSLNPEALRLIALARLSVAALKEIYGLEKVVVPPVMNDPTSMFVAILKRKGSFTVMFGPDARDAQGVFHGQLNISHTNPPKLDSPFLKD